MRLVLLIVHKLSTFLRLTRTYLITEFDKKQRGVHAAIFMDSGKVGENVLGRMVLDL